jgi:predicted Ser/Thr protein kinase
MQAALTRSIIRNLMALNSGDLLGPYEILAPIGAGGMGEVYRARDTRLGRDVAIKVLAAAVSQDAERLRRFEQEARATGMLNHPNILAIYDVGTHEGSFYVVSELLEGETLRERQAGQPLPQRRAVEYALAIAHGLAAAHAKGIVHRDLKPENIFITNDNRVKILDFGLAKLTHPAAAAASPDSTSAPTMSVQTTPGVVMGTAGYMSPEQVRGQPTDHRTDIFAFGAILFEMLTGRRAFQGESTIETMNAVLKEEPPELTVANTKVSPAFAGIVRRCPEKRAEERFESARDLAFALEAMAGLSTSTATVTQPALPAPPPTRAWAWFGVAMAGLAMALVGAYLMGRGRAVVAQPALQRLTFRHGMVFGARFAPDGQTILYNAAWEGKRSGVFTTRVAEHRESREMDFGPASLASVSSSGELAILLNAGPGNAGTLARVSLAGGAPRKVLDSVTGADWHPTGSDMLVVRRAGGRDRLEYPAGKVLYETAGAILFPRFSPRGDRIAFAESSPSLELGKVAVVDLAGNKTTWVSQMVLVFGVAWMPGGNEIAVAGVALREYPAIWAVNASGQKRLLLRVIGTLQLNDVAADSRMLVTHFSWRANIMCQPPGEKQERDLAWLDWSNAADLSDDGKTLLFDETREGGLGVYLRKTDGSVPVRLGEGFALALSPDGAWAASIASPADRPHLELLPTGAGESRKFPDFGLRYAGARYFPDGKRLLLIANEQGRGQRPYVLDLVDPGAKPKAIAAEGAFPIAISPDGKTIATIGPRGMCALYPVDGGEPKAIQGLAPGETPLRWTDKPGWMFIRANEGLARTRIFRFELATGRKEMIKEITLADPAGTGGISRILLTPDGGAYAYNINRNLSDLYLATSVK